MNEFFIIKDPNAYVSILYPLIFVLLFSITHTPKEVVATHSWSFYMKGPIHLCLHSLYTCRSPLSIDTKRYIPLIFVWRHYDAIMLARPRRKFWSITENVHKELVLKTQFWLKNRRNMRFSFLFFRILIHKNIYFKH